MTAREPFNYHGIEIVPDDAQAQLSGSVFRHVLEAREKATMHGRGPLRVHLHPLDVERLLAEAP